MGEYDGVLREIIHAFKYAGRRSLAVPLAERMRARGEPVLNEADCLVPVPLHWKRRYERGFNQARELARHLGLPVVDGLVRTRSTRPQVELTADMRRRNVAGVFGLRARSLTRLQCRTVVLVDDVSTTGATLDACARVLLDAGVERVFALTAARVINKPPGRRGFTR